MFAPMSDEELIRHSDLVIVGEWFRAVIFAIDSTRLELASVLERCSAIAGRSGSSGPRSAPGRPAQQQGLALQER